MERIELSFNLPCHLKVTSYRRSTGSHAGGYTIDLRPFVEGDTREKQIAEYVATYSQLFGHLKYGVLRINSEKSNWHYHLESVRGKYESGAEHYVYDALNKKYIATAPTLRIDNSKYGALAKYSKMLDNVILSILGLNDFTSIFSVSYWKEFVHYLNTENKQRTFIYFEPDAKDDSKISRAALENILQCFDGSYVQTVASAMAPGSPEEQQAMKGLLILASVGFFLLYTKD
jgi:hypothetical protein